MRPLIVLALVLAACTDEVAPDTHVDVDTDPDAPAHWAHLGAYLQAVTEDGYEVLDAYCGEVVEGVTWVPCTVDLTDDTACTRLLRCPTTEAGVCEDR
ncbi:MAG: hypothetical protein H6733_10270 [Alphaproteobacteria bacterium]|nr:hypothetical protein [Alphaproteobacteria bacterium]